MDTNTAKAIVTFLMRVKDIQGPEAPAFVQCVQALQQIIQGQAAKKLVPTNQSSEGEEVN